MDVEVLNSTSVLVKWEPVPENLRHGIIIRYTILYKDEEKESNKTTDVEAPASSAIISGLRQKAEYLFQIQAATSKGKGPLSTPPVPAQTDRE